MSKDYCRTLISYRLERSQESIEAARILFKNKMLTSAMNRIYYSMFYSVQALLILKNVSFSKHGQVKGYFNREFIKTEIFPKKFGRLYNKAFEYRQKFDYVDLVIPESVLVDDYIKKADNFIREIKEFIFKELDSLSTKYT